MGSDVAVNDDDSSSDDRLIIDGEVVENSRQLDLDDAKILEPSGKSGDGEPYTELWGGVTREEGDNIFFSFIFDPEHRLLPLDVNFSRHEGSPEANEEAWTSLEAFSSMFLTDSGESDVDESPGNSLNHKIKLFLASDDRIEKLTRSLREQDPTVFSYVISNLLEEVLPGSIESERIRARLRYGRQPNTEARNEEQDEQNDTPSRPTTPDEPDVEELESENLPNVRIQTSAVNGIPVEELKQGEAISVRLKGQIVEILPEDQRESRQGNVSKPFPAEVVGKKRIETDEDESNNSDSSADQWKVLVELENAGYAEGVVSELEKIAVPQPENDNDRPHDNLELDRSFKILLGTLTVLSSLLIIAIVSWL